MTITGLSDEIRKLELRVRLLRNLRTDIKIAADPSDTKGHRRAAFSHVLNLRKTVAIRGYISDFIVWELDTVITDLRTELEVLE